MVLQFFGKNKQHNFFPALLVLERIFHWKCDLSKPVVIIWDLFNLGSASFASSVKEPGPLTHAYPLALTALIEPGGCSDLAKEL